MENVIIAINEYGPKINRVTMWLHPKSLETFFSGLRLKFHQKNINCFFGIPDFQNFTESWN